MRKLTPATISSFIGKDVRLVYPVQKVADGGVTIEVDHKITPLVKLLKFTAPATAEIQRADGKIETIRFEEAWDPSAVKPVMTV